MNQKDVVALSRTKKLVVGSVAVAGIVLPVILGVPSGSVAVAQIGSTAAAYRPLQITKLQKNTSGTSMSRTTYTAEGTQISNTTVRSLIEMAYNLKSYQLTGGPSWIDQERFDITYTGGEPVAMHVPVYNAAVREILSQRFHLVLRQETKNGPVMALVVGDGGVKFAAVTPQKAPGTDEPLLSMRVQENGGQGQVAITGGPGGLADTLSSQIGQPIVDKTGLTGTYDINFHWSTASVSTDSLSSDLQQQLGLSLVAQEGPVQTSIIESVTIPSGT